MRCCWLDGMAACLWAHWLTFARPLRTLGALLQTAMKVEEGVRQLEKAEKKQRQSAAFLCVMVLLVMIVILILFIIFKAILF